MALRAVGHARDAGLVPADRGRSSVGLRQRRARARLEGACDLDRVEIGAQTGRVIRPVHARQHGVLVIQCGVDLHIAQLLRWRV